MSSTSSQVLAGWASKDGVFRRQQSQFRDVVKKGGRFEPEKGRYHLYISHACPWAHRTAIVRRLKGLEDVIGLSVVNSYMGAEGWSFVPYEDRPDLGVEGTGDRVYGYKRIRELYLKADPNYSARFTVPVFWDTKEGTIVNNESSEIIRFLNDAFDDFVPAEKKGVTFYPEELRGEIDSLNEWVYDTVNNGVYKAGFATTQEAYENEVMPLFESLDRLEKILSDGRKYLVGGRLTEADIRLYTTLVRFDPVYVGHFKCNIRTIRAGYPVLHRWLRKLYWGEIAAFRETTDFKHIKAHYYQSHPQVNPTRVVPVGPVPDILPLQDGSEDGTKENGKEEQTKRRKVA